MKTSTCQQQDKVSHHQNICEKEIVRRREKREKRGRDGSKNLPHTIS